MLIAFLSALLLAQPVPTLPARPVQPSATKPRDADPVSTTPTLDQLSPAQRKLVEKEAQHCVRLHDGTIWTDSPLEVLREYMSRPFDKRLPTDVSVWYCPATREWAKSLDDVFSKHDGDNAKVVVKAADVRLWDARVAQVIPEGLLVRVSDDVAPMYRTIFVSGYPRKDKVVDEQAIGLCVRERSDPYRFQGRTLKRFEWVDLKDYHVSRETAPVSAEELAAAMAGTELPPELPRWVIKPAIISGPTSDPSSYTGSDLHGHTSPALYHNAVHGWRLDRDDIPLDFGYSKRQETAPAKETSK